ncbi:MAG: 4-hydroxybenzoate octaprenyltransferase [Pseudomonadota bacterium]
MARPFTDIRIGGWIDRQLPDPWRPYGRLMRLDRPIGTWLLLLPCWWGLALAERPDGAAWPSLWLALLFAIGAFVMRGAGCTVNDLVDAEFDARVERTSIRPIPSGEVSKFRALVLLLCLMLVGLIILLQFNMMTVWLGVASLALVFPYPLMKRVTYWPQLWLGLTFNWGALMGWSAVTGSIFGPENWPAWLLYVAGIFWTLGYDTIYAHQDKEDDALIGVKSTALRLGAASRRWIAGFYAITILLLAAAIAGASLNPWAFAILGLAAIQLCWQVAAWRMDEPADSLAKFQSNTGFGLLVTLALVVGQAVN